MNNYHTVIKSLVVLPKNRPIFDEMATEVRIEDEAGGPFIVMSQHNSANEKDTLRLDEEEWPLIKYAVERLIKECKKVEEKIEEIGIDIIKS